MSQVIEHIPTTRRGQVLTLVGTAAAWVGLYALNEHLWDWMMFGALGLDPADRAAETIHFFLYDTAKITLLLIGIIFIVTVLRSYMSVERTRALLGGKREGVGNVMAAGLGVITPFCSCSAVPAFIGFVAAGVPLGVTMSFLIASPMVNEIAIGMLFSLFGLKMTVLYIVAGLVVAIVAGWIIGRVRPERWVEPFVFETTLGGQAIDPAAGLTMDQRIQMGIEEVVSILRKIWPYLLVGIGLGAVIHGWVPTDFFTTYAGPGSTFGVVIAVAIGIPLYSNAAGIMPMVQALYEKGLPMGTLLAFMMAVVALSLPEMILLRRVLKPQLLALFVTVVGTGIVAIGYLFNSCSPNPDKETTVIIKVLGPGCANCKNLERVTREAVAELGVDATIETVEDYALIAAYGIMSTPGLVIDEKVVASGRVPKTAEVRDLIAAAARN